MTHSISALWVTTSSYLQRFDQPLLQRLRQHTTLAQWQYQQSEDEPCALEVAVDLLHDYVQGCDHPIHLLGHGTGGLVSLLYARQCPQRVRSLTLLGVGAWAMVDWIAHYYFHLQLLPCSRRQVLTQLIPDLFGAQNPTVTCYLTRLLEKDLAVSPSPHSLFQQGNLMPRSVPVPLLVCGSANDPVVDSRALEEWQPWLKGGDRMWQSADGPHFFHCFDPQPVAEQILDFWRT
ncbi:MAG: alpha/beta hydrolase, partial [Acaryochloris sp. SU_5_25]|nr:alpha/beta hydrolase [Acaryochloris sp. SU_5_25]